MRQVCRRYVLYKDGDLVDVLSRSGGLHKRSDDVHDTLSKDRIFSVDTESTRMRGVLTTDLVPIAFDDRVELLEYDPRGTTSPLVRFLETVSDRFSVPAGRPTRTEKRRKRKRKGNKKGRDGRRAKVPVALSIWFNMPYDLGRLFPQQRHLRAIHSGVDGYKMRIDERWEIEWERYVDKSAPQFSWYVRDLFDKRITRLIGLDLTGYWKCSLEKALAAMRLPGKIAIEDQIPGVHDMPWENFEEWQKEVRRDYARGDADRTRKLYLSTVELLQTIDARIVKKDGLVPPSAPGAAAKLMFARAFDCHPEASSWKSPPVWVDQMGASAYYGGRSFCAEPGVFSGLATLDLTSAYPTAMCLLPDPVSVEYRAVVPEDGFDLERWRGRFGVLEISGENLDPVYPTFRVHEEDRLRYVHGKFEKLPVTIPEIVIGVARGALRVDRIEGGVWLDGGPEKSFLRKYVLDVFAIKDAHGSDHPLGALAKLLLNAAYGKLIEAVRRELACEAIFPVVDARGHPKHREIAMSMIRCVLYEADPVHLADLYLGDKTTPGEKMLASARLRELSDELAYLKEADGEGESQPPGLVTLQCYSRIVARDLVPGAPFVPLRDVVRTAKRYTAGRYFMPIYAAQVTGLTSAELGAMAAATSALAGDTDAVHVRCAEGDPTNIPGVETYFDVMRKAGYPAPREGGETIAGTKLGMWVPEMASPSLESVLVRPKRYSHRYMKPDKKTGEMGLAFKQATHGLSRFDGFGDDRAEKVKRDPVLVKADVHEAMRRMLAGETVHYRQRRAPRKGRTAARDGKMVGEFVALDVFAKNDPVRGTFLGKDGIVRWEPLSMILGDVAEAAQ